MVGQNEHDNEQEGSDLESVWIQQARRGDKRAFSRLVEAYQRPVYSITYRMLGNPDEAEDAAQEAFLRAYSNLHKYDPDRKFSTWLFSIANHYCIDKLRKRRVTWISIDNNPVLGNLEGDAPRPERRVVGQEERDEVQRLVNQLEPGYRMPLVLRYWEECSYEEIAEIMEISVPAVKSRLFRARQQVAKLYSEQEPVMGPPGSGEEPLKQRTSDRSSATLQFANRFGLAMSAATP